MAVFGKVSSRLAASDAIENEFFRWQTHWRIGPKNLVRLPFVHTFDMATGT
jgi:hypothetical protein